MADWLWPYSAKPRYARSVAARCCRMTAVCDLDKNRNADGKKLVEDYYKKEM